MSDSPNAACRFWVRVSQSARERHEIDTITAIVHQMMPSDQSDIAVQESHGHIIIVRGGSARAYSGYDSDQWKLSVAGHR